MRDSSARRRLRGYLQLLRPANVVTAFGDVLAGYAAAALAPDFDRGRPEQLVWLLVATGCLYGGGVVLNDVFDRKLDAIERPERPIPSAAVSPARAAAFGAVLLAIGVAAAAMVNTTALAIAMLIAVAVVVYDALLKPTAAGPLAMASCRALNITLGVAAVPGAVSQRLVLPLLMAIYIGAITVLSRGEVHGGRRTVAAACGVAMTAVVVGLVVLAAVVTGDRVGRFWGAALLSVVLGVRVLPRFWRAYQQPSAETIRAAVRTGVLSLLIFDAVVAVAFGGPGYATAVLALIAPAQRLAKAFAVT